MRPALSVGLTGLVKGLVIGIALTVVATRGLGVSAPSAPLAALLAGVAGFVVGLVAGRPIWARDAKTEALLKAAVGALVGVGSSFALRHWLSVPLDLNAYSLGAGPAGKLAALSLPLISSALALFFELDNAGGGTPKPQASRLAGKHRVDANPKPNDALRDWDVDVLDEPPPGEQKREKR